ncbi:MAG: hypothetical protein H0T51_12755 [Pirellulales bacterium]|nr:hypothetical protein [Pirellulales bacterium]
MQGTKSRRRRSAAAALALAISLAGAAQTHAQTGYFGTAKVNINPQTGVMLSGYAARSTMPEATAVQQNIYAQAAAFGMGAETALLLAVDCTGVPDDVADPLSTLLSNDLGIAREKIVVSSTHSHSCPHVTGYLSNLFDPPLSSQRQGRVDQYTALLSQRLEEVARDALDNRTPGHEFSWANGSVGFGFNRRGGSVVDHDLPVMLVRDSLGQPAAIITSYATHAVTLFHADNLVSGDWPGYAREAIEAMYPGAAAMVMIGAGADSNPTGMGSLSSAQAHGQSIANEVQRLINQQLLTPVSQQITGYHSELELDYATQLTPGDPSSARLAPSSSSAMYGVTSWTFGNDLAMVFMEGEVVADYSLRLKAELGDKVWVNAYSNDVQGYIPSERILYEGGYEADGSSYYYALPGRFAHGLEDKIVGAVHDHLEEFAHPDVLELSVDWGTGAMDIHNHTEADIAFDGYTIISPGGRLNSANGSWNSLQDQSVSGWDQADNSNAHRLTEFNPTGTTTLAVGASRSLGAPFVPPAPASFGIDPPDVELTFEYSVPGVGVVEGFIETNFPHNNLVLTINPATGEAAIQNESPFFDVSIDAYTIASADGALLTGNGAWNSLQDQGVAGWDQADNASAFRLTEFKSTGATFLAGNETVLDLGAPVNTAGGPLDVEDFTFEFKLSTGTIMEGIVQFGEIPGVGVLGDFDEDEDVDGADFLLWQRTLGTTVAEGSGADGSDNGVVDAADLAIWQTHFGETAGTAAAVLFSHAMGVPEPGALSMAFFGAVSIAAHRAFARKLRATPRVR